MNIERANFLETVVAQTAIALERLRFRTTAEAAKLYEASEKLHQTLLNSVSHELRTPITAIIGTATALAELKTDKEEVARQVLLQEMTSSARRLDRVVENLLDVSRLEKGSLQLKKEWFEVGDLLALVKSELKTELSSRELRVGQANDVLLEGDYQLLDHALSQLVLNAVKYSRQGTPIDIDVETSDGGLKLVVSDEGAGLPPGCEEQLFEKFFRLPGSPAGGLGLGLSIVKSIVELHGGHVSARNRFGKTGAEFEMWLPLKTAPRELVEAIR